MNSKLLKRIDAFLHKNHMMGTPATAEQIAEAEEKLGVKFSRDYVDFISRFGDAYAGLDIWAFEGNETVVSRTESLREVHREVLEEVQPDIDGVYVISDDGSGNPIVQDPKGRILLFDHDNNEFELLSESLEQFIEANFVEW